MLRGIGLAGLALAVGPACTAGDKALRSGDDLAAGSPDRGDTDLTAAAPDRAAPALDAAAGLPPIDLAQPKVTRTATFALG